MNAECDGPLSDLLRNCSAMLERAGHEMKVIEQKLLDAWPKQCPEEAAPIELQNLDRLTQTVSIVGEALQLAQRHAAGPAPDLSQLRPVHLADLLAGRATGTNHIDIELF